MNPGEKIVQLIAMLARAKTLAEELSDDFPIENSLVYTFNGVATHTTDALVQAGQAAEIYGRQVGR